MFISFKKIVVVLDKGWRVRVGDCGLCLRILFNYLLLPVFEFQPYVVWVLASLVFKVGGLTCSDQLVKLVLNWVLPHLCVGLSLFRQILYLIYSLEDLRGELWLLKLTGAWFPLSCWAYCWWWVLRTVLSYFINIILVNPNGVYQDPLWRPMLNLSVVIPVLDVRQLLFFIVRYVAGFRV